MAESLYDLLAPYLKSNASIPEDASGIRSSTINRYLARLTTLPLSALSTTEPQSLEQASHTNLLSLQALASRSLKSVTSSANNLSNLNDYLPTITDSVSKLRDAIPQLDEKVVGFSTTFSKSKDDNELLDRRKQAMLLSRNVDRLSDMLELPTLLSNTIASAGSGSSGAVNYSQALDLFAHMKRLQILYPDSDIVKTVVDEAESAMKDMTANLISSLRGQNIRLAAAIRTIGWLRRVAPELDQSTFGQTEQSSKTGVVTASGEGLFGSLFLTARLANLLNMLEALEPLRDLADQETHRRKSRDTRPKPPTTSSGYVNEGQQTERYLKRYIEIFREQSFATVSMYRNVFPPSESTELSTSLLLPLPSALASFPLHLAEMLMETLGAYLPNISDATSRESLLMQVLYAAGSLGRLGADFTMMISTLFSEGDEMVIEESPGSPEEVPDKDHSPEWVRVIEKHRVQSARLSALSNEIAA
jgi:conserved oligomeric Golgi complex subunit 8